MAAGGRTDTGRQALSRVGLDLRIKPQSVLLQTVEKLRETIMTGVFEPGSRLVEANLCDLFAVSRPVIREALRSLEAERLISIIPNRGPLVRTLSWKEAAEIYQVRSLLEGEAARVSAERATPADVGAMRAALKAFNQAVRCGDATGELTSTEAFYAAILRSCGNTVIEETLSGLAARINFLRAKSMSRTGRSKSSAAELAALLAAIEAGDGEAARTAAVRHVARAQAAAKLIYNGADFPLPGANAKRPKPRGRIDGDEPVKRRRPAAARVKTLGSALSRSMPLRPVTR
jgi:GntR family transcriptional regulator, trigonelline degradation regulator